MTIPDTTEAMTDAIAEDAPYCEWFQVDYERAADRAIAAHNAELAKQGYEIVKVGTVPSWMEVGNTVSHYQDGMHPLYRVAKSEDT